MPAGRPRKVVRPVQKNLAIPQDIVTKIDLLLWSDLELRVPHGAWQSLIVRLLTEFLKGQERMATLNQEPSIAQATEFLDGRA